MNVSRTTFNDLTINST